MLLRSQQATCRPHGTIRLRRSPRGGHPAGNVPRTETLGENHMARAAWVPATLVPPPCTGSAPNPRFSMGRATTRRGRHRDRAQQLCRSPFPSPPHPLHTPLRAPRGPCGGCFPVPFHTGSPRASGAEPQGIPPRPLPAGSPAHKGTLSRLNDERRCDAEAAKCSRQVQGSLPNRRAARRLGEKPPAAGNVRAAAACPLPGGTEPPHTPRGGKRGAFSPRDSFGERNPMVQTEQEDARRVCGEGESPAG